MAYVETSLNVLGGWTFTSEMEYGLKPFAGAAVWKSGQWAVKA